MKNDTAYELHPEVLHVQDSPSCLTHRGKSLGKELIQGLAVGKTLTVLSDEHLTIKDDRLADGTELEYYGILTDVYQRELMTEAIREKVDGSKDK